MAPHFPTLLIQMPVLLWNISNDFASFPSIWMKIGSRKNFLAHLKYFRLYIWSDYSFSPTYFCLKNEYFSDDYSENRKSFIKLSKFIVVWSYFAIFIFFYQCFILLVDTATVILIPFLVNILRLKVWQYLHFYGIVISLILVINISVYPISAFFGNVDRETAILFGWVL